MNTQTCAAAMAECSKRLIGKRDVNWVELGRRIKALVVKMDNATPEAIADEALAEHGK